MQNGTKRIKQKKRNSELINKRVKAVDDMMGLTPSKPKTLMDKIIWEFLDGYKPKEIEVLDFKNYTMVIYPKAVNIR